MSELVDIGLKMRSFESATEFDGYTRVTITVSDDLEYTAGDDTGRELALTCPWGSQDMADTLLARIKDYRYQPYKASGAYIDPAAELGDYVFANGVTGGIFSQDIAFGRTIVSDVSAPGDEEIDHEYPYVPSSERKINRQYKEVKATLLVQADLISAEVTERESSIRELSALLSVQSNLISAKVSKSGGDSASFGWDLTDSAWIISADGSEVLKATKDGISVTGEINATSGVIGGCVIVNGLLSVPAVCIAGTLTVGQLPDGVATTSDIPTKVSALSNDSGYQTETGVTTIINGVVTADYVNALGVTANSLTVYNASGKTLLSAVGNSVEIAGWSVDSNSLYSGNSFSSAECFLCTGSSGSFNIGGSGQISGWMLKAGSNWGVTKAGAMYATDAYIKGKVEASSGSFSGTIDAQDGSIGGWEIGTYTTDDDSVDYYSGPALIAELSGSVSTKVVLTPQGVYYSYYNGSKTVTVYASWATIVSTTATAAAALAAE